MPGTNGVPLPWEMAQQKLRARAGGGDEEAMQAVRRFTNQPNQDDQLQQLLALIQRPELFRGQGIGPAMSPEDAEAAMGSMRPARRPLPMTAAKRPMRRAAPAAFDMSMMDEMSEGSMPLGEEVGEELDPTPAPLESRSLGMDMDQAPLEVNGYMPAPKKKGNKFGNLMKAILGMR
jgi:hypothetical protein